MLLSQVSRLLQDFGTPSFASERFPPGLPFRAALWPAKGVASFPAPLYMTSGHFYTVLRHTEFLSMAWRTALCTQMSGSEQAASGSGAAASRRWSSRLRTVI